ncbi:ABC transporter substrate-binding protein [Nocardia camponoti]|uniref:Taurine ABC transporter substrate-binding protein n=1 Tax=Nocardia camponoti TaxID=1616106 RepID=A0A917QE63_9NOCA|nr:ABC transporter substrate-binding protein [Nocardia camponoti]GGK44761.1 taurine ABC transporter substrate-binding protein [Nocardia camponoti]
MKPSIARLAAVVLTTASLAVSLVACTSADRADPTTLTVGFVVDPSWAQIPVADKGGYFAKHNVTVKVVNFPTGVEALQAVAAGQIDVATAADVPTSAVLTRSPSLRVVGDGSRWVGSRIVARRSAGITTVADLAGKSIGTPIGTSAAYFASSVLAAQKMDAKLVQVAPSAMVTAATQSNVDAVSIFQPYQAQVVQALGADAVELDGGTYKQHSLYLASKDTIAAKSAALSGFFAALKEANEPLKTLSDPAVAAVAAATQLDPALLRKVLAQFDFTFQSSPELAVKLGELGAWAKTQGKIPAETALPDYATLIDTSAA